jgi:hypothetical protein
VVKSGRVGRRGKSEEEEDVQIPLSRINVTETGREGRGDCLLGDFRWGLVDTEP